jgi:hypothetical protein
MNEDNTDNEEEVGTVITDSLPDDQALALAEAVASTSWAVFEGAGIMQRIILDLVRREIDRSEFGPATERLFQMWIREEEDEEEDEDEDDEDDEEK